MVRKRIRKEWNWGFWRVRVSVGNLVGASWRLGLGLGRVGVGVELGLWQFLVWNYRCENLGLGLWLGRVAVGFGVRVGVIVRFEENEGWGELGLGLELGLELMLDLVLGERFGEI